MAGSERQEIIGSWPKSGQLMVNKGSASDCYEGKKISATMRVMVRNTGAVNTGVVMEMQRASIGIITVSDRASRGEYEDLGGPAIRDWLNAVLVSPWEPVSRVIADEQPLIEETLRELCDTSGCCLVVTTGGTGPALRDVTPEATEAICDKMLPGFGELMRQVSLRYVPTAILSRQTAGVRGKSLIVNLPGKPSAIGECLDAVFPAIPYCIDLLEGPYLEADPERIRVFRPAHAKRK